MDDYSVVGKGLPRVDAPMMVTGKAVYGADLNLPGALWGKILRSPYPHAHIKRIDMTKAQSLPGVWAVVIGADAPEGIFAKERVLYQGQKVAAVAGESPDICEDALELIEVEYEPLPVIIDPLKAMEPDAPTLREDITPREYFDERGRVLRNIAGYSETKEGDVEQGFSESDVIVEATFRTPVFHQCYIEPHAAAAQVQPDGRILVWSSTQGMFTIRSYLAQTFNLSPHKIKVIATKVGGGFGGKNYVHTEAVAVLLAQKTGRPVKVVDSRYEVFLDGKPGPSAITMVKAGAKRDGSLTALKATVIWDAGAYGGGGEAARLRGLYRWKNFLLRAYGVYTNKLTPGAYRAPSSPQMAFVSESVIDMLAKEIGMDPLELRLKNAVEEGDVSIGGFPLPKIGFKETLKAAAEKAGWGRALRKNQGRGIACGEWHHFVGSSAAYVILNQDGTVQVVTGSVDITGTDTTFAQIVAEELNLPVEKITVSLGDTDTVPYHDLTAGSRTAYATGTAVKRAAQDARQQMIRYAAQALEVPIENLELSDGKIQVKGESQRSVSFAEIGQLSIRSPEGAVCGKATLATLPSRPAYSVHIVDLEVDPETGVVQLLRIVAAQDVGFALNRMSVEGQIQGGATQALGFGLMEGYKYDENDQLLNPTFLDYTIPTVMDVPRIETVLVEVPNPDGPYGAKGVGEPPIIPTAAAIANAIASATGVRITELPITPERIVMESARLKG